MLGNIGDHHINIMEHMDSLKQTNTSQQSHSTCGYTYHKSRGHKNISCDVDCSVLKIYNMDHQILTTLDSAVDGIHKHCTGSQASGGLTKDYKEYEHQRSLLVSIAKSHNSFLSSATRGALEFMLYKRQNPMIIDLTVAYILIRFGHHPTGAEVLKTMMEHDFQENAIVEQFSEYIKTEPGAVALESTSMLPLKSIDQQPKRSEVSNSEQHTCSLSVHSQESSSDTVDTISKEREEQTSDEVDSKEHSKNNTPTSLSNGISQDQMIKLLIQKENIILENKLLCRLCKQNKISVTLLPCGHFVLCSACSELCQVCPCCQKVVLAEKKTYLC